MAEIKDIKELEEYPWPKAEWFDYTNLPEQIKRVNEEEEFCLMSGWANIFETSWFMRGFEQAFIDMIESPEILHFIMEKVMDFHMEHTRRILEAGMGEIDLIFTADDIGSQQGLLMSLGMWEKYIKPYHVKLNDMIHDYDTKVIYHTDGAVMDAVSGLIDMGIDILQALQFDASGMDPKALKNAYGDRLGFEGGVSVQKTLPFGTSDDVRQETQALMSILGKGGGYILGPSHVIQAGTPVENILAMFETAVHSQELPY
jgi:uroporphyrinogen decarboxylase